MEFIRASVIFSDCLSRSHVTCALRLSRVPSPALCRPVLPGDVAAAVGQQASAVAMEQRAVVVAELRAAAVVVAEPRAVAVAAAEPQAAGAELHAGAPLV